MVPSPLRTARRLLGRSIMLLAALLVGYTGLATMLGLVPVNRDFVPAADGIELSITANLFHTDIILPMSAAGIDWASWCPPEDFGGLAASHIAFGWGDRDFYLATPRLADFKPRTALKALLFSPDTVLHVRYAADPSGLAERWRVRVTTAQYRRLAAYLRESFRTDDKGRPILVAGHAYGRRDAFYEAVGRYSFLTTCNEWLAAGLRKAGIPTGWWAPFALGITAHLEHPDRL